MSATPEQIADWLIIVAVGDAANEYTNRAEHMRAAAALIRAQDERVRVLEGALGEYLSATAAVFAIDPATKKNWAELDPRKSDECLRRFQRLDAAGKSARAALKGEA